MSSLLLRSSLPNRSRENFAWLSEGRFLRHRLQCGNIQRDETEMCERRYVHLAMGDVLVAHEVAFDTFPSAEFPNQLKTDQHLKP